MPRVSFRIAASLTGAALVAAAFCTVPALAADAADTAGPASPANPGASTADAADPGDATAAAALVPVDFSLVHFDDAFWSPRLETMRTATWPHNLRWCEQTNRLRNFDVAAGRVQAAHEGYFFNDSDVYKALEGACRLLILFPSDDLRRQIDSAVDRILAAQQPDGYLNTYFTVAKPGQRWTADQFHELYCAGTLFELAIAYDQATGDHRVLDAARRNADHIDTVFGPGRRLEAPEHPEIELALLKLWQYTHEPRYLELARFFLDQRGRARGREGWGEYAQDHKPLAEQREIVGHAVRATYLAAAATDLARLTADETCTPALAALWNDLTHSKLYITAGIGASMKNEGFTRGYDLPNEQSYAETCASIGLAFWAHRLNLLYADAAYFDVFERALYNGILAGVSLSGDRFSYVNPLASHGPATFRTSGGKQGQSTCHRQEWFQCACCPPNILRFIPSIGGYMYATCSAGGRDAIYVNLFAASSAAVPLGEARIKLTQQTNYPWDGRVRIRIEPDQPRAFDLLVRVPGWCRGASFTVNGQAVTPQIDRGYAGISREWRTGDTVELNLPMPIERIQAHPLVHEDTDRVALQRGPIVYCLEQADNAAGVFDLVLPPGSALTAEFRPDLLGGVTVLRGPAARVSVPPWAAGDPLYRPATAAKSQPADLTAVPYFAWDNRTPGQMLVWIPEYAPRPDLAAPS